MKLITHALAPAAAHAPLTPATPQPPTSGLLHMVYGDWLSQLGAIDGGETVARDTLQLRFDSNRDALLARAALSDAIDGVKLLVMTRDGAAPVGDAPGAGDIASFLTQIRDLAKVETRRTPSPAFVVSAHRPDILSRIDPLLRDEIAGLPVRWQTL